MSFTENKLGYVADYCMVCHGITAHRLVKLEQSSLFSGGETLGWLVSCRECDLVKKTNPATYEKPVDEFQSLEQLMSNTFPQLPHVYGDRLQLERTLRDDPDSLSPEERNPLLREVFESVAVLLDAREESTIVNFLRKLIVIVIGVLEVLCLFSFAAILISSLVFPEKGLPETNVLLGLIVTLALLTFAFWYIIPDEWRWWNEGMDAELYHKLLRGLQPIQPTSEELQEELNRFSHFGISLPESLTPEQIRSDLDELPPRNNILLDPPEPDSDPDPEIQGFGVNSN